VERMCPRGLELIVGARNDPNWGPILLVGFGGILAEVAQDLRILPASLGPREIEDALLGLRCGALFRGFRGQPELDSAAAAKAFHTLSRLVASNPSIREIEINPLVVYAKGSGVIALDALVRGSESGEKA
jgi:acetate---CoA ligase (ADP-forming)